MFGSLPRVPPQKCRFERPLAERRKTGTDPVKPLDTLFGGAGGFVISGGDQWRPGGGRLADVQYSKGAVFRPTMETKSCANAVRTELQSTKPTGASVATAGMERGQCCCVVDPLARRSSREVQVSLIKPRTLR